MLDRKNVTQDMVSKMLDLTTKSTVIRYLTRVGFSRSEIAKMLDIRYQHVRNVLTQECKIKDLESDMSDLESKILDDDQLDLNI
jgi:hypothetical protein